MVDAKAPVPIGAFGPKELTLVRSLPYRTGIPDVVKAAYINATMVGEGLPGYALPVLMF